MNDTYGERTELATRRRTRHLRLENWYCGIDVTHPQTRNDSTNDNLSSSRGACLYDCSDHHEEPSDENDLLTTELLGIEGRSK